LQTKIQSLKTSSNFAQAGWHHSDLQLLTQQLDQNHNTTLAIKHLKDTLDTCEWPSS
jgi:hypothetical protein